MRKLILSVLVCYVSIFSAMPIASAGKRSNTQWWINTYGESNHPLKNEACDIFQRVLSAADKPSNRYPKLVVINMKDQTIALSLEDGGIILTEKALDLCYNGVTKKVGAARLAFVLGHEIAHLTNGDFWHVEISEFIQKNGSGPTYLQKLYTLSKNPENIKKSELLADSSGLLYAYMAGYDPAVIVAEKGTNFFKEWVSQPSVGLAYHQRSHPSPEDRADHFLKNFNKIKQQINYFELGVRFYQKGDYNNALVFLEYFRQIFPCREVFNNIGLVHYQKAVNNLTRFDPEKAFRFKLSIVVDTNTRAGSRAFERTRGVNNNERAFSFQIQKAIDNFKIACQKDKYYSPARVNLSSALILAGNKGDYAEAMGILEKAMKTNEHSNDVMNNYAIARYLFGRNDTTDMAAKAIQYLKVILDSAPDHPYALYNLGSIYYEQGKNQLAQQNWERFIETNPNLNSRFVEQLVKRKVMIRQRSTTAPKKHPPIEPPVALGYLDKRGEKFLKNFSRTPVHLHEISGIYYKKEGIRVWIGPMRFVELVEYPVQKPIKTSDVFFKYGKPNRIISTCADLRTFVYDNFALDVRDNQVAKIISYEFETK